MLRYAITRGSNAKNLKFSRIGHRSGYEGPPELYEIAKSSIASTLRSEPNFLLMENHERVTHVASNIRNSHAEYDQKMCRYAVLMAIGDFNSDVVFVGGADTRIRAKLLHRHRERVEGWLPGAERTGENAVECQGAPWHIGP